MTTARRDPKKKTEYGTTYRFIGYHHLILWERGEGRVSTKKQCLSVGEIKDCSIAVRKY
jgi:hypothetical protein